MKKRSILVAVLLVLSLLLPCALSSAEAPSAPEAVIGENGLYCWTVDNHVFETKTNILDYIDGNVFNSIALAESLGWEDRTSHISKNDAASSFKYGEAYVTFTLFWPDTDVINHWYCYGLMYGEGRSFGGTISLDNVYKARQPAEYMIDNQYSQTSIPFDGIVLFTYALEHMAESHVPPFEGLLGDIRTWNSNEINYEYHLYADAE